MVKRYRYLSPPRSTVLRIKLQGPVYAWVHRLSRFYGVAPGVIVERGVRMLVSKARKEAAPEEFEDMPSMRRTVRR